MDTNNSMVLKLGPDEFKNIIRNQVGFFQEKEKHKPNCCMLGIAVVQVLDSIGAFSKGDQTGDSYFEGLKVYLDGDNECAINVGYSPFITKQGIIL